MKRNLSISLAGLDDSEIDFDVDDNKGDSGYELDERRDLYQV